MILHINRSVCYPAFRMDEAKLIEKLRREDGYEDIAMSAEAGIVNKEAVSAIKKDLRKLELLR